MSHPLPLVSIVVPTRNRAALLRGCLESLFAQNYPSDRFEIIVASDGSSDDTANVVGEMSRSGLPSVRCLRLQHIGVNGARNAGIMSSGGEIVCVVDDDELVQHGHLSLVVDRLLAAPELDGVGGPCRTYGRTRFRTCSRCALGTSEFAGTGRRKVNWLLGGNMALRKRVFEQRGLFDEELSGFGDEWEWFQRDPPLDLLYDPDLWVWHRRDRQSLLELCRSAWSQGQAIPLTYSKVGITASASVLRLLRYLGHGVVRLCGSGLVLACREAGSLAGERTLAKEGPEGAPAASQYSSNNSDLVP